MQSKFFGFGMGTFVLCVASVLMAGCGDDTTKTDTTSSSSSSSGAGGEAGAGGAGGAGGSSTGGMGGGGGAGGSAGVCTGADKTVCATFNVPADYTGTPAQFIFGLYKALPPAGPPDAGFANPQMPALTPGMTYQIEVTNIPAGDYYIYGAALNAAGFPPTPKSGDYQGSSTKTYTAGGAAVTADPIDLTKVP